jgi:hypothetical protein
MEKLAKCQTEAKLWYEQPNLGITKWLKDLKMILCLLDDA